MGILGNMFGMDDDRSSDMGARIALASQVLMAMDQGQVANIAPALTDLNAQRRKYMDQAKSQKWLQSQAAAMADKNPRMAQVLENAPPGVGESLISKYLETQFQPPDWKTFESGGDMYRVDMRDPNAKPSLLFDGPDDPFKRMVDGITGGGSTSSPAIPGQTPAPGATPAPGSSSSATPDMPPAPTSELPPMLKQFAQAYALPEGVTANEVLSIAQAGAIGGKEQAAATAEAIRKRYADSKSQDLELTKQQKENSFKLFDDYRGIGERYQKIIDTATEVASLPDDPSGFERIMILYKTMKTLDPGGAVMAADTGLAQSAATPLERMDQLFQKYSGVSGTDIPLPAAQEMKRLVLELGEIASKADYVKRKSILRRAEGLGIPADKAEDMIFGFLQENADALEGYTPRFTPGPRSGGAQTDAGGGEAELEWTPSGGVQ